MPIITEGFSLKNHNTFGLDVSAKWFAEVHTEQELQEAILWAKEREVDLFLLGGGSNVLLTQDLDCLVVINAIKGITVLSQDENQVLVRAAAGEIWHDLVVHCIHEEWGGIENMSLIPGTVGAAPMQNIGAYGVEIKDVFVSLTALHRETLETKVFSKDECQFGYRESVFKRDLKGQYIITSVTLRLSKKPVVNTTYGAITEVLDSKGIAEPSIKDVSEAVIDIRRSKLPDPKQIGNSGSFFKNPVITVTQFSELKKQYQIPGYPQEDGQVKVPAGWLIEQAGWKGKRLGNIGVHDKQALVLVNHGGGEGSAIYQLAMDIQASVQSQFGIEILPEVNVL
ncbi:UDP-N-acetylmuramate dehydrogenase [Reichenbachiella agarivorans]|uniref:UDP-N-acetylenolpyruvoylglucosamine reductase n=1 Tax=Reichenbachiella agarivorans TaxID=2979464 RepID=A0ABY6CMZ2_9BACT|nr:UDP-N-acetylmuramate dehydrogenase [Reichenbachiella agarivorans]UXP31124.1 UDP-N-acetylmuramate dehydrogenase [Reichenbachiella agarivorans]